ncbi:helix-turn-helix domain-containing protein [Winogradskyella luteola]|uniref:Helix-turn-helix domain-containing protein n=1 Tax=Winogradskyella luteola TaxID=2828330 RepID=A0A9X1JSZ6_9FLAO|nr:helix-turn-helix domain-containing protein [Winogradskyella luteola]MBV7270142.1 helix-turn-helix domain-containing protein [Winogradskyella luteola]
MKKELRRTDYVQKTQLIAFKEILSFREALIYLDVSESFLYKLTSKGAIEFTKPNGGKLYFKKSDLDNWMMKNESTSKEQLEQEVYNHLKGNSKQNHNLDKSLKSKTDGKKTD